MQIHGWYFLLFTKSFWTVFSRHLKVKNLSMNSSTSATTGYFTSWRFRCLSINLPWGSKAGIFLFWWTPLPHPHTHPVFKFCLFSLSYIVRLWPFFAVLANRGTPVLHLFQQLSLISKKSPSLLMCIFCTKFQSTFGTTPGPWGQWNPCFNPCWPITVITYSTAQQNFLQW